jgi:2-oxoisovalerate dehydrogenase E2 component (dihydrolipoyl transacylase)
LARFAVAGLRAYPVLNSRVDTERQEIVELGRVDLGIAVQSPRGLVVPAAIINHPQVAMVGFGRILDGPWVVAGEVAVRKVVQMSFVFDHRVCDGGLRPASCGWSPTLPSSRPQPSPTCDAGGDRRRPRAPRPRP